MAAHLEWLDANAASVRVAGALRTDPDAAPVGACWVVEGDSRAAVEALIESDPFWVNGVRAEREILYWSKAFPERLTSV